MSLKHKFKGMGLVAAATLYISLSASPSHAQVGQVDGTYWMSSTDEQKQAYLVGVANLLSVNQALLVKRGVADENSPFSKLLRSSNAESIKSLQDKLDAWYKANPDKMNTPVLGVFWLGVVKAANR